MRNLISGVLILSLFSVIETSQAEDTSLKVQQEIQTHKKEFYRNNVPSGIFHAPKIVKTIEGIVRRFQKTGLVDGSIHTMKVLSSSAVINGWIEKAEMLSSQLYYISGTKGFLDLISNTEDAKRMLGEERAAYLASKGVAVLAAMLAHEFGHMMNGDLESEARTTRMYKEMKADIFAVKILAAAGYDPTAMIDLLQALDVLHKNPDLKALVHQMMDEHPKPRFRIANIVDLVETVLNVRKAQEKFGFSSNTLDEVPNRALPRDPVHEKASKTSSDGVKINFSRETYQKLNFREKLQYLSNIFSSRSISQDEMAVESIVQVISEYKNLLNTTENLEDLKIFLMSLGDFEEKNKDFVNITSKEKGSNVKLNLRELKRSFVARQMNFLNQLYPEGLTLDNFNVWASHVDSRELIGLLTQRVAKATTEEEIRDIFYAKKDNELSLQEKIKRIAPSKKYPSNGITPYQIKFLQMVVHKLMVVTNDLDRTMSFLIHNSSVNRSVEQLSSEPDRTSFSIPYQEYVFAEVLNTVFEGGQYKIEAFLERVQNPKTAYDRVLSNMTRNEVVLQTSKIWLESRNWVTYPNLHRNDFVYGSGLKTRLKKDVSRSELQLAFRLLNQMGFNFFINEVAGNKYTLGQTFDLLIESVPSAQKDFWLTLKNEMILIRDNQVGMEVNSQVRVIVDYLSETRQIDDFHTEEGAWKLAKLGTSQNVLIKDLHNFLQVSKTLHDNRVVELYKMLGDSSSITYYTPNQSNGSRNDNAIRLKEGNRIVLKYPELTAANINVLSDKARYELLRTMIVNDQVRKIQNVSLSFTEIRKHLEEGLQKLIYEKHITTVVMQEFLQTYDEYVIFASKIKEGDLSFLTERFFKLQRSLRVMTDILNEYFLGLSGRVSNFVMIDFFLLINKQNRLTDDGSIRFPDMFLASDKVQIEAYLKNPTPDNQKYLRLELTQKITQLLGFFEGLGSFEDEKGLAGLRREVFLAKLLYEPAEFPILYESRDTTVGMTNGVKPFFVDDVAITIQEQEKLYSVSRNFLDIFHQILRKLIEGGASREQPLLPGFSRERFLYFPVLNNSLKTSWSYHLYKATTEQEAIPSLLHTLVYLKFNDTTVEAKTFFLLAARALSLIKNKTEMELFTSLMAQAMKGSTLGNFSSANITTVSPENVGKLAASKYRQLFFDTFAQAIVKYDAFNGQGDTWQITSNRSVIQAIKHIYARLYFWTIGPLPKSRMGNHTSKAEAFIYSLPGMRKIGISLSKWAHRQPWLHVAMDALTAKLSEVYTKTLLKRDLTPGSVETFFFLKSVMNSSPWSERFDQLIANYIYAGHIKVSKFISNKVTINEDGMPRIKDVFVRTEREIVVDLLRHIKSLPLRSEVYDFVLKKYGFKKVGFLEGLKDKVKLLMVYRKAASLWTEEVLQKLANADNLIAAWKIKEQAWRERVGARAASRGISQEDANKLLIELLEAKKKVELPAAQEVEVVFLEGSQHRDKYLEHIMKMSNTTFAQLKFYEKLKSYNYETPYHKFMKAALELIDEYSSKMSNIEKADMALYLARIRTDLQPSTKEKIKKYFRGTENRQKMIGKIGAYLTQEDLLLLFAQATPEEKLIAFRGLLLSGIIGDKASEEVMIHSIFSGDPDMPSYLRKLLQIYLKVVNDNERSILVSWLMANRGAEPLKGPQILKLLIEKGGVVPAKIAQLIASHGFHLSEEYQNILEQFKGNAQKIDKIEAMKWIQKRLPPELFEQIEFLGQQLGAGSFKIGYLARLKDGRNVVIMLPREYVLEKTLREFEIFKKVLNDVMKDPELMRENLWSIQAEVERIISEEMKIQNEYKYMKQHKQAYEDRPLLVKLFGNQVKVMVPQPLEGWHNDQILVEEYVEAKGWGQLPETSLFGWNKRDLAKASINEVLNQLLSYMNPKELVKRNHKVILDIDPHEENQITKTNFLGLKDSLVNIDLGQSVSIDPSVVRGLVQMVAFIYMGKIEEALQKSRDYMSFKNESELEHFAEILNKNLASLKDPFEILTKTFEEVEFKGITLKTEYLFFQKLFATLVGLKKHVGNENYLTSQAKKILFLRAVSNPKVFFKEFKDGMNELNSIRAKSTVKKASCEVFFGAVVK